MQQEWKQTQLGAEILKKYSQLSTLQLFDYSFIYMAV